MFSFAFFREGMLDLRVAVRFEGLVREACEFDQYEQRVKVCRRSE